MPVVRRGRSVRRRRGKVVDREPQWSAQEQRPPGPRTARIIVVPTGPVPGTTGPMVSIELARIEALELLGMTLAHLNDAETRAEVSPRVPVLIAIRDKLALALREESS